MRSVSHSLGWRFCYAKVFVSISIPLYSKQHYHQKRVVIVVMEPEVSFNDNLWCKYMVINVFAHWTHLDSQTDYTKCSNNISTHFLGHSSRSLQLAAVSWCVLRFSVFWFATQDDLKAQSQSCAHQFLEELRICHWTAMKYNEIHVYSIHVNAAVSEYFVWVLNHLQTCLPLLDSNSNI